ncbi:hypothetical protein ANANG_G00296310 [Anguilla anguilla]|uniref:WW domain-containing protein n=1 Tax=Anguilla anguilla TaxID=7936 RepID=A0A9D3RK09_ANGAN|nr:hypothetical protein ANANG_G00296310 [Anguilla anguilla]
MQGRRYYVNTSSNETTWECPAGAPAAQKSPLKSKSSTGNGHHPTGSSLFQQDKCSMAPQKTSTKRESPASNSPCRRPDTKDTKITINSVTFPLPSSAPEQPLLKPGTGATVTISGRIGGTLRGARASPALRCCFRSS